MSKLLASLIVFLGLALPAFSQTNVSGGQAARFRNGDVLHGSIISIDPGKVVKWTRPDLDGPLDLSASNITDIVFSGTIERPQPTNHCIVRFTNDDEVEGSLVYADAERIVLQTWFADAITIPRKMVRLMLPIPPEKPPIFQGPTSDEGWTHGKVTATVTEGGNWEYRKGAFYATRAASIARNVNLPDVSNLEFDLAWSGLFHLAIALYTDYMQPINLTTKDTEPNFAGFYSLQLNSFSANLLPVKKGEPLRYLGQAAILSFSQKNRARVSIRINKTRKIITLMVDGVVAKQWIEPEDFAGGGKGVRFVHQGQGSLRISNLRVTEWNGLFEDKTPLRQVSNDDLAILRNGDKVSGTLKDAREGNFTFTTGESELVIPHNRIKHIEFATSKSAKASFAPTNTVRAFFTRNRWLSFQMESYQTNGLAATSDNFGRLVFKPTAFERLQFNPTALATNRVD